MSDDEYFLDLVSEFPFIKDRVEEEEDYMTHSKMEKFADYTISQILARNTNELIRCFEFQENKIELLSPKLLNAITVSYCEALLLGEARNEMGVCVSLMGSKLRRIYLDYEKYYNELAKKSI